MAADHRILYLERREVEALGLGMAEVVEAVEEALRGRGSGRTIMPAKHWLAPHERRFYSAMTGVVAAARAAACKWQSGSAENAARGLPYITGLLILNDDCTGLPIAIMDSTWLTAMRTAAATAVTAKYLAPRGSETVAVLGCGVQGRANVESLGLVLPNLRRVQAYDIDPSALRRYANDVSRRHGVDVRTCGSAHEAIEGAQVVVTAGPIEPTTRRTIEPGWLGAGALAVALDYDCYWQPAALRAADKLFTDDRLQMLHLREYGYFCDMPDVTAEISDVVTGGHAGRARVDEAIIAVNMGIAVEDVTTARRIYDRAVAFGRGVSLRL